MPISLMSLNNSESNNIKSKVNQKLDNDIRENLIEERREIISVQGSNLIPQMLSLKANVSQANQYNCIDGIGRNRKATIFY
jgi:hypothetical protein